MFSGAAPQKPTTMQEEVKQRHSDEGQALFEDVDFPSDDTSLFSDLSTPIAQLQGDVTWARPQEICTSPSLFPECPSLAQAKQGLLGDCWLLCACTVLLKHKHLLDKVLPADQPQWGDSHYTGSFRFRFWQLGLWTEVTVDDRLPCVNSALCFSRCLSPAAFWVALLEKAYAKLHGSYERLWAGQVCEALVDLTGGLTERWSLGEGGSEEEQCPQQDSDRAWRRRLDLNLLWPVKDSCSISCSTHRSLSPTGPCELDQYHALSVEEWLDVGTLAGGQVRLLRIRNPWGRCCWMGAWVERGIGWNSVEPALALDLQCRAAEGEFWLDEGEFRSMFHDVTVGFPLNEEDHLQSIYTGTLLTHTQQVSGRWITGHTAGGCRNGSTYANNPKFWLRVCERGEVLVALLQHCKARSKERRARTAAEEDEHNKHQHYQAIALHMWKVEKKRFSLGRLLNKPPCVSTSCHAYQREVVLHAQLEPAYYLLVPSTFHAGAEARFLIRVFSSSIISLSAQKNPAPSLPPTLDGEWETVYFRGSWVTGQNAGGSRNYLSHWQNPCFPFTVCHDPAKVSEVNVRATLRQSHCNTDLHPIGFHIYRVAAGTSEVMLPRDEEPAASCVPHCYTQDVSLSCCLPAGAYALVPSTYQPDCQGSFTLSLAHRIHRKVVKSREQLGRAVQEVSHISLMHR